MLRSGFLGVLGNNGFSKGMFIYMYIHINSNSIFNQFCKCAIISQESANCRWVIILEQYHKYHWKSTRSQVLLKLYSIIGIAKMYTITWTVLKMFNITGTLSHVLVKLYDISSITYNVQITGMLLISMPMEWTVRKYWLV